MYLGKLVEIGPASEVYGGPRHPYTAGLIEHDPGARPGAESGTRPARPSAASCPPRSTRRPAAGSAPDARWPRICARETPELRQFGPEHLAACHFPLQPPIEGIPRSSERFPPAPAA